MRFERQQDNKNDYVDFQPHIEGFHQAIQNEISKKQKSKVAVVVFFETEAKLNAYLAYLDAGGIARTDLEAVTQEKQENIDHYVEQATRLGHATLFTKFHGRGTDFQVVDTLVESNGGMHVVQTFLSEEKSEEIQIRGRSARQEKSGTYQLILLQPDLEKFEVPAGPLNYELLDAKRTEFTNRSVSKRKETVEAAHESHIESMDYAKCLRQGNFDAAMAVIDAQCTGATVPKVTRLRNCKACRGGNIYILTHDRCRMSCLCSTTRAAWAHGGSRRPH
jgi:preprotein translocase subunit SecA